MHPVSENGTATVEVAEDTFTRTGGHGGTVQDQNTLCVAPDGRSTYLKFDITTLKTTMGGKDAKYTLKFATNSDRTNATGTMVQVYGITWKRL